MYASRTDSARDPCPLTLHRLQHLVVGCHGCIARRRHRQSSVSSAALHRPLSVFAREESVNSSRGEGISSTGSVVDFQVLSCGGLIEFAVVIADRAPVIDGGTLGESQSRRHYGQRWILLNHLFNHALKIGGIQVGVLLVQARHRKTEGGREVFFISE